MSNDVYIARFAFRVAGNALSFLDMPVREYDNKEPYGRILRFARLVSDMRTLVRNEHLTQKPTTTEEFVALSMLRYDIEGLLGELQQSVVRALVAGWREQWPNRSGVASEAALLEEELSALDRSLDRLIDAYTSVPAP